MIYLNKLGCHVCPPHNIWFSNFIGAEYAQELYHARFTGLCTYDLFGSSVLSFGGRISPFLPYKTIFNSCSEYGQKVILSQSSSYCPRKIKNCSLTFFPVFIKSLQLETCSTKRMNQVSLLCIYNFWIKLR